MKPRETGGNITRLKAKPKTKIRRKDQVKAPRPEVAVQAPTKFKNIPKLSKAPAVKAKPEATRPVTQKQRTEINRRAALESAKFYAAEAKKDKPNVIQRAGVGIPAPVAKALTTSSGTAQKILEKTTIPLHAVAGSAENAAGRGFKGLTPRQLVKGAEKGLKNKTTYSDVLKTAGVKNKVVRYGVGLTGDILLDPTTYVTFGTAAPAKAAAAQAAKAIEKKALAKGLTEAQAKRMGARKAEQVLKDAAAKGETNKGLTVGVGKHRTSGKTTAAIDRRLGVSTPLRRVREGRKVLTGEQKVRPKGEGPAVEDIVGSVHPGFRKVGVPENAHNTVRSAEAEKRAAIANQERRLARLARTYKKDLNEEDYRRIIDAIESGTVGSLRADKKLHDAAVRLRSEFRHMDRLDRQAGIRAATRKNYVARVRKQDVEPEIVSAPGRAARGGSSARKRTIDMRMAQLRQEHPELFTEDIPSILAKRGPETIKGVADVKLMRELAGTGTRYKGGTLREGEAVYHVPAKSSIPVKVEKDADLAVARDPVAARKRVAQIHATIKNLEAKQTGKSAEKTNAQISALKDEARHLKQALGRGGQYVVLNEKLTGQTLKNATRPELSGVRLRYRRAHGKIKTVLTMPMPSYHLRNVQGDVSNASYNLNARELASALGSSGKALKARRKIRAAEGGLAPGAAQNLVTGKTIKVGSERVPVEKLIREAEDHGAIGTGFSNELRKMAGEADEGKVSKLRDIGQGREDFVRLASYIGARRQGLTAREAAKRVRDTHFDYADLTSAERGLRDVIPFYTFAARNTPFQAKTLLQRPGKIARYQKLVEEGSKAAGIPPDDLKNHMQEYERLGLGIPLFGLRAGGLPLQALPGNPATDLNRLTLNPLEQAKQIGSMVTIYKAVPESLFNYSLFFRGQIDQGKKVAAPDWIGSKSVQAALPDGVKKELGLEYIYDAKLKRKVWKWKAKWDYLLKQLPETSFAFGLTTSAKNRRGQDRNLKLLSLTGVRPQPIDKVSADLERAFGRQKAITNRMRQLNDAGVTATAIKEDTVPKQARSLIPEYKRLKEKWGATAEVIYNLRVLQLKRGDAVKLPKAGAPPKPKSRIQELKDAAKGDERMQELREAVHGGGDKRIQELKSLIG